MLVERFRLKAHREQRETPVYRTDRGEGWTEVRSPVRKSSCSVEDKEEKKKPIQSSAMENYHPSLQSVMTMTSFAIMLSRLSKGNAPGAPDRPVIDATGLSGKYDFVFESGRAGGRGDAPGGIDVVGWSPPTGAESSRYRTWNQRSTHLRHPREQSIVWNAPQRRTDGENAVRSPNLWRYAITATPSPFGGDDQPRRHR